MTCSECGSNHVVLVAQDDGILVDDKTYQCKKCGHLMESESLSTVAKIGIGIGLGGFFF